MSHNLTIIQYNCGNSNYKVTRPFFDAAICEKQQVLVIQEPYFNKRTKSTYCPLGYHLLMRAADSTKICFMVSQNLRLEDWQFEDVGAYAAILRIRTDSRWMAILNTYISPQMAIQEEPWT